MARFSISYAIATPGELEGPDDLREYLNAFGIPVLMIEDDYSISTIGQLRTRIQAFLEMIG